MNKNYIGYIQEGYLSILIYDVNDMNNTIKWCWSDENKIHTSKLRYDYNNFEYKFRIGRQWYGLNEALKSNL